MLNDTLKNTFLINNIINWFQIIMEGIEINGKIDLGVRSLVVAHVENAITFYGYLVIYDLMYTASFIGFPI